jgi:3-dehydroquinate synthetase
MSVRVELGERSYEVLIGPGELAGLGRAARARQPRARVAFVVLDPGVPRPSLDEAIGSLTWADFRTHQERVEQGESCKTTQGLERLVGAMARAGLERGDVVVTVGGGAACDLAGFAASIYRRGIAVVHCPTTLLAMVDASVGGKTGINLSTGEGLKKNMIGTVWQPDAVIADVSVLPSLPERELRAGLAECLKHGMIGEHADDAALLDWTAQNLAPVLAHDPRVLTQLVERNVALKARIVAGDEREEAPEGGRALLNLGHTFAHVIETLPGLAVHDLTPPLLHGECVALGLIAASACSESVGIAPQGTADLVRAVVAMTGLPTSVRGLPDNAALAGLMAGDKKSRGGVLRVVLPTGAGRAIVVPNPDRAALAAGWDSIRSL